MRANPAPSGSSTVRIVLISFVISASVLVFALLLQWVIYHNWLDSTGPLRIVGSSLAAVVTFIAVFRWQTGLRQRHRETLQRFETIARMNDRIRNSLQAIECLTYASSQEATEPVRRAVDAIDSVLLEVLAEVDPAADVSRARLEPASRTMAKRKSA